MNSAIRKIIVGFGFVCLFASVDKAKAQAIEKLTVTLSKPGKPFVLNLALQQGSIQVSSYSGSTVEIEAVPENEKSAPGQNNNQNQNKNVNTNTNVNTGTITTVAKNVFKGKYISAVESANSVTITPLVPKQKLSILVRVPKNKGGFHLSSTLRAAITLSDVMGELDITNNGGQILLKNISGSAVVSNVAGGISASFTNVSDNTPMAFSTVAGVIDVSFPSTVKANIKINSDNGELFSDFEPDFIPGSSQPKINRTSQGQYHIETASGFSGRIGGGGANIRFKNMVGNIYIRKNK